MYVCDVWLARDFLHRTRRPLDIPPCTHRADLCPPIREGANDMTEDFYAAEATRLRAQRDEAWAWLPYEMRCTLTAKWQEQDAANAATAPNADDPKPAPDVSTYYSSQTGSHGWRCATCGNESRPIMPAHAAEDVMRLHRCTPVIAAS
jgi:anti-sigma factor RsiW